MEKRDDRDGVVGAIFLVFAGLTFLLNNLGLVSWEIWAVLVRYWPILLILAGFQMIIGGYRWSRMAAALAAVLIFGSILLLGISETNPGLLEEWGLGESVWIETLKVIRRR